MSGRSERIDLDIPCLLEDGEDLAEYVLPNFEELCVGEQDL
jgi:hypothetical protein